MSEGVGSGKAAILLGKVSLPSEQANDSDTVGGNRSLFADAVLGRVSLQVISALEAGAKLGTATDAGMSCSPLTMVRHRTITEGRYSIKRATFVCILVLVGAMVVGAIGVQGLRAEEKEYKPKAKVTPLVKKDLLGVEGKEVLVRHFEFPSGYVGGRHFHPGPVFVYVLEGELTVDTKEQGRQTFKAGEVYEEPIHRVMQARNLSTTNPTKIVVFQVGDKGKPMMIRAK